MNWVKVFMVIILVLGVGFNLAVPGGVAVLDFAEGTATEEYHFFWSESADPYLRQFRKQYNLEALVTGAENDFERFLIINEWVSGLWDHHGNNIPEASDPLSILAEVEQGQRFRCVEYAVVVSGALNALGIPARVLGLKTADVETRASGAGHVVAEAYLEDMGKWIFIDGQWNTIPLLDGLPLNAVEFQQAIAQRPKDLELINLSTPVKIFYLHWIKPYLYYFDAPLDNQVGPAQRSGRRIMLVPLGAAAPTIFQRHYPIGDVVYTNNVEAFYPHP